MSKKTIIIILSVLVAAATSAIELLSSCSTGTIFHRVTPADSVYYERHVNVRPGSLSRVFPFSSLQHNVREELQKISPFKRQKAECNVAKHSHFSAIPPEGRPSGARFPRTEFSVQLVSPVGEAHFITTCLFNSKIYRYV